MVLPCDESRFSAVKSGETAHSKRAFWASVQNFGCLKALDCKSRRVVEAFKKAALHSDMQRG